MRRLIRPLALIGIIVTFMAAEWMRESPPLHTVDLRVFDADAVGRLETAMWRSYYERRRARLFRQMVTLLETEYHMPPMWAIRDGYRAAHAAIVFQDGRSRREYERALPDLERYYQDIAALASTAFDPSHAARLELEWWIVHRENPGKLAPALAGLQAELYRAPASIFLTHAELRAEAMRLRDLKGAAISDADWSRIGELLRQSWTALRDALASRK